MCRVGCTLDLCANVYVNKHWHICYLKTYSIYLCFCTVLHRVVFSRVLQIKTHTWEKTPVMLVGNKCDAEADRVVQSEEGEKLATELGT